MLLPLQSPSESAPSQPTAVESPPFMGKMEPRSHSGIGHTIDVKEIDGQGQGLFATKDLSTHDTVCSLGHPIMMAIDTEALPTTCYSCLTVSSPARLLPRSGIEPHALKVCTGCQVVRFCNKDCQTRAWAAYHKYECKIFRKSRCWNFFPPHFVRVVMRIVLLRDKGVLSEEEWTKITDLTSHEDILRKHGQTNLTTMAEDVRSLTKSNMGVEMIEKLIFIMRTNQIELSTSMFGAIGIMVDPLLSKFNHSCAANVMVYRPQWTMSSGWMSSTELSEEERMTFLKVIPLRNLREGEELCISYHPPTSSVHERNAKYKRNYYFECQCKSCISDRKVEIELREHQPDMTARFRTWEAEIHRNLQQLRLRSNAFAEAVQSLDCIRSFLNTPPLYTTGTFPEACGALMGHSLDVGAFDQTLISCLRLYFLVYPYRFEGKHNPCDVRTMFILLEVFDALLDVSASSSGGVNNHREALRNLAARGLSKTSLGYWRERVCLDLRRRLESSAAKDFVLLLKKWEEPRGDSKCGTAMAGQQEVAEQEMRSVLQLDEDRWLDVLSACGC